MRGRSCPAASPSARPRVPLDSGERAQGGGLDQECSRDSPVNLLESQIERDRDKQKPRRADAKSRWLRRTLSRRERHRRLRYASSACTAAARRARLLPIAFLDSHPSCGRANWQSSFLWTGPLSFRWRRATRQTYVLGIAERMTELELRTIPLCSLQWTHIGLPVNMTACLASPKERWPQLSSQLSHVDSLAAASPSLLLRRPHQRRPSGAILATIASQTFPPCTWYRSKTRRCRKPTHSH